MNHERLMQVIMAPHVSEKSARLAEVSNQHVFKVAADANKLEIKKAVELLFEVKVENVRVVNIDGKAKMFARRPGRRNGVRKAYVSLEAGQDIQLANE